MTDSELLANSIEALVQRVAGTSVQEIDGLIAELQALRALLEEEAACVQRNLAEYAHLNQSAMQSTRIIAESLAQWKHLSAPLPPYSGDGMVEILVSDNREG
jgi:hypothetical protein